MGTRISRGSRGRSCRRIVTVDALAGLRSGTVGVMRRIAWFCDLRATDFALAGGKGANLGELAAAGLPVPPAFVDTAEAFLDAVDRARVRAELNETLAVTDVDDPGALAAGATRQRDLAQKAPMQSTEPGP